MGITLLIKSTIKSDRFDEVCSAVNAACPIVRREEGCVTYDFYVVDGDHSTLYTFECWADEAALEAHNRQPHMDEFRERFRPTIEKFEVFRLSALNSMA